MVKKFLDFMKYSLSALCFSTILSVPVASYSKKTELYVPREIGLGRPSVVQTWEHPGKFYFHFPDISLKMKESSIKTTIDFIDKSNVNSDKLLDLKEEIESSGELKQETLEELAVFLGEMKKMPNFSSSGESKALLKTGYKTIEDIELHFSYGIEGAFNIKARKLEGTYELNLNERNIKLPSKHVMYEGYASLDHYGKSRIVMPLKKNKLSVGVFVEAGYRKRYLTKLWMEMQKILDSSSDIENSSMEEMLTSGDGIFVNSGLTFDLRKIDSKWMLPIMTAQVKNVYNNMQYDHVKIGRDPVMFDMGLNMRPGNYFDLKVDVLDITNSPETRMEVGKKIKWIYSSIFGVVNERTLLGYKNNSINFYLEINDDSFISICGYFSLMNDMNIGWGAGMNFRWDRLGK